MHLNELAKIMKVVGDENRLKILCVIFRGKKFCVSQIAEELDLSVAITSHHLKVMSKDDLVVPIRNGKMICYEMSSSSFVKDLKNFICKYK